MVKAGIHLKSFFLKGLSCLATLCLLATPAKTLAFALLGPVQPWMQASNGVIFPSDIGGPMHLGSGYRWNVPVLTYGFDQPFLNFFGSNGVAAIESAIQILNDLPPASQIVLTNYPFNSTQFNSSPQAQSFIDLKSRALSLLLAQLGLAPPMRNIYVLQDLDSNFVSTYGSSVVVVGMPIFYETVNYYSGPPLGGPDDVTNYIAGFNFDPETLQPSFLVNGVQCAGTIHFYNSGGLSYFYAVSYPVDPLVNFPTDVADSYENQGGFLTGLTRDDVGGLRYLLSTNNVKFERLLSNVSGVGTNSFVNGVWRPGVDKITFVPQLRGSSPGTFLLMTNQFTDIYITNGNIVHQQLQRVTARPDFLFSAGNDLFCTGTTNWVNNAAINNNSFGDGPGVIRPPVNIVFQKMGSQFYSSYPDISGTWSEDSVQNLTAEAGIYGSFTDSTNAPFVYPIPQTGNISMSIRVQLRHSNGAQNFQTFEWSPTSQAGTIYAFQTSTNLAIWNTLFVVTNNGSLCTYQNVNANSSARFYRLTVQ